MVFAVWGGGGPGSLLEAMLDQFREHVWCCFGAAFYKKRGFACMGAHCSKASMYLLVSLLSAGISEIAVFICKGIQCSI